VRVGRVLEDLGADVVALQEIENEPGPDPQLDYLATRLGLQAIPGLTLVRPEGEYGNALLTRLGRLAQR
jgi:phospholipase D1/2